MKPLYAFAFTAFFCIYCPALLSQNVVINEVLASNISVNTDEDGDHEDWVEIYNIGPSPINLNGYGLSDDSTLPMKWIFPNVTLGSGSYLLVWCSDKNRNNPANPLHSNFKISSSNDAVYLTSGAGVQISFAPALASISDVSYGKSPNATGPFMFFESPTPGAANNAVAYSGILPTPVFSHPGGFYTSGFNLTLSTTEPGSSIIYTLDGSEPDPANLGGTTYSYKNQYPELPGQPVGPLLTNSFATLSYSSPISIIDRTAQPNKIASISSTYDFQPDYIPQNPIFKGTVVRAKLIKPGALSPEAVSRTYFVTPLGTSRFTLPVVSLSLSEDKLYDFNNGIYVAGVDFETWRAQNPNTEPYFIENIANFYRRGIENERVANFSYFVNGSEVINQDVGIRISGGSSRAWQNKSLAIYARDEYGDETMDYPFFPDQPTNFEGLILRNSGGDFFETLFRDALNHRLMKNLNVITKGYQPTITFMNGEYWGILNFRDKIDDNYFNRMFDIPRDEIDVLASQNSVEEGDSDHYEAMYEYFEDNSLSVESNYNYIKTQLDPENFADYFISNIFFQNVDWPGNNIVYWRKKTSEYMPNALFGHDGRWRWLAHDMDATFAVNGPALDYNSLAAATATNGPSWPNPAWSTLLLRRMLENEGFKQQFISRFADLMNTSFLSSRIVSTMEEMKTVIEPEIPEQSARWKAPENVSSWNYYLNVQNDFATQRHEFQRNHIRTKFNIASNINATISVSNAAHGYVKVNTIDIKSGTDGIEGNPYPWTGIYFSNIPVKLKAIASPGFVFSNWTGASSSTNPEITITSANSFSATAVFTPTSAPAADQPIYFWMMDSNIPDDLPLQTLNSTYEINNINSVIQYQSCLVGYPFSSSHPNWRKASMERRDSPIDLNYIPEANENVPFVNSNMKGLQIKEPLQNGSLGNTLLFIFTTEGYKDIKFSFAAMNESTNANAILVDYSINAGAPVWITSGIVESTLPLSSEFQLHEIDFSSILTADNNPNFKIRLRFSGTDMTADNGNRITFNNIAVRGTLNSLGISGFETDLVSVYPNPATNFINVSGINGTPDYKIFALDGRLIESGVVNPSAKISVQNLSKGMYILDIFSDGRHSVKKIIKH